MNTYLYGACGNQGCLSCTPSFIVEAFSNDQYEANIKVERINA